MRKFGFDWRGMDCSPPRRTPVLAEHRNSTPSSWSKLRQTVECFTNNLDGSSRAKHEKEKEGP